jgi:hypothetical protein
MAFNVMIILRITATITAFGFLPAASRRRQKAFRVRQLKLNTPRAEPRVARENSHTAEQMRGPIIALLDETESLWNARL